jgi:hypothetical protein
MPDVVAVELDGAFGKLVETLQQFRERALADAARARRRGA